MMSSNRFLWAALAALAATGTGYSAPAEARVQPLSLSAGQNSSDQGEARKEMRAGNQLSLREIERRILPRMRDSEYLGPSYDSVAHVYRLKFIREGRVTYLDIDARSGRIIDRSR
ncbi:MAG: hypothetical protein WA918_07370 [Erythrobacter sp.]